MRQKRSALDSADAPSGSQSRRADESMTDVVVAFGGQGNAGGVCSPTSVLPSFTFDAPAVVVTATAAQSAVQSSTMLAASPAPVPAPSVVAPLARRVPLVHTAPSAASAPSVPVVAAPPIAEPSHESAPAPQATRRRASRREREPSPPPPPAAVDIGDPQRFFQARPDKVLVQRPAWIQHGSGLPITSIDFHPDGSKVATAGADGYICIWSTQMLGRDEFSEDDSTSSLLLCTITTHQRKTNTVSCVRFSPDGHWLASTDTDGSVKIHFLDSATSSFAEALASSRGNLDNGRVNFEHWTTAGSGEQSRFHGDVPDIAWNASSTAFATASIDNSVAIWRVPSRDQWESGLQRERTLQHSTWVCGVAWDPVNRYLASQTGDGEDGMGEIKIWRTDDWTEVKRLQLPMAKMSGYINSTAISRLHWSPDGEVLMLPRGKSVKGAGYGAIVVHRNQWTFEPLSPESAVHIRPLSVIRFAPSMPQDSHAYLFALAGLEGTLAVCMSTQPKPLLIVDNFCEKSVLDICWSPRSDSLLCCTSDGVVLFVKLPLAEFGISAMKNNIAKPQILRPVLDPSNAILDQQLMGNSNALTSPRRASSFSGSQASQGAHVTSAATIYAARAADVKTAQRESTDVVTKRRKIMPVTQSTVLTITAAPDAAPANSAASANSAFVAPVALPNAFAAIESSKMTTTSSATLSAVSSAVPLPVMAPQPDASKSVTFSASAVANSTSTVEATTGAATGAATAAATAVASASAPATAPAASKKDKDKSSGKVKQKLKGQKKLLTNTTAAAGENGATVATAAVPSAPTRIVRAAPTFVIQPALARPELISLCNVPDDAFTATTLAAFGHASMVSLVAAASAGTEEQQQLIADAVTVATSRTLQLVIRNPDASAPATSTTTNASNVTTTKTSTTTTTTATTTTAANSSVPAAATAAPIVPSVAKPVVRKSALVQCMSGSVQLWTDELDSAALCSAVSPLFAAACDSRHLYLWSRAGRRLLSPMLLKSQPVALCFERDHLLLLCSNGDLRIYSCIPSLALLLECSAVELFPVPSAGKFLNCSLSFNAVDQSVIPLIALTTGDVFAFQPRLRAWTAIINSSGANAFAASGFHSAAPSQFGDLHSATNKIGMDVPASFESSFASQSPSQLQIELNRIRASSAATSVQRLHASLAHCESQIGLALAAAHAQPLTVWLERYVGCLADASSAASVSLSLVRRLDEAFGILVDDNCASAAFVPARARCELARSLLTRVRAKTAGTSVAHMAPTILDRIQRCERAAERAEADERQRQRASVEQADAMML